MTRLRRILSAAAAAMVLAVATRAAATLPDDPLLVGGARAEEVVIRTVEPPAKRGRLLSFDLEAGLRYESEGEERRVDADDVVTVAALSREAHAGPRDATLSLVDGGVLFGQLLDGADDRIVFEARDVGRVTIPMEQVAAYEVSRAAGLEHRDILDWFHRRPASAEDRALFANGDVVAGFVTRLDADGAIIDVKGAETKAPAKLLLAVRLAAAGRIDARARRFARVDLRGGSRLRATSLHWTGREARLRTEFAPSLTIESERVLAVHLSGGRWEWLSDHQPISADHTPAFGTSWDLIRDANVLGRPIIVGGDGFERGLGVHSRSRVVYDLRGEYRAFVTSFGLDDAAGAYADVTVSILVDGQSRFRHAAVRPGALHGPVSLDITGAKRIELLVDFGDNGDIQDRFNWVEPAIIR